MKIFLLFFAIGLCGAAMDRLARTKYKDKYPQGWGYSMPWLVLWPIMLPIGLALGITNAILKIRRTK